MKSNLIAMSAYKDLRSFLKYLEKGSVNISLPESIYDSIVHEIRYDPNIDCVFDGRKNDYGEFIYNICGVDVCLTKN